jgi:hypothetical protein
MVTLECTATRTDGITLVTGRLENEGAPRHVRVEHRLDGPVWPPLRRSVPAAGWSDGAFECELAAAETRALGYATPAPADDDPLTVVDVCPVDAAGGGDGFEPRAPVPTVEPTANGVLRALGSPLPPTDAVPVPAAADDAAAARARCRAEAGSATATGAHSVGEPPVECGTADGPVGTVAGPSAQSTVHRLAAQLERDAAHLRAVAERAETLATHAVADAAATATGDAPAPDG